MTYNFLCRFIHFSLAKYTYAIDKCKIPIIICYVNYGKRITGRVPSSLKNLWPASLKDRIDSEDAKTIHIPFKENIILEAINKYDLNSPPAYPITIFKDSVYDKLNID